MIVGLDHAGICVRDLQRSLRFYRDLLGLDLVYEGSWKGDGRMDAVMGLEGSAGRQAFLRAGPVLIELFEYQQPTPVSPGRRVCDHGLSHLCLQVTDLDGEYERLQALGVEFNCPPQDFGLVRTTYGHDPDGNVLELQENSEPFMREIRGGDAGEDG